MSAELLPLPLNAIVPQSLQEELVTILALYVAPEIKPIKDTDDKLVVSDTLKTIKAQQKRIKELEATYKKPVSDLLDRVRALFKPVNAALEAAETASKKAIIDYDNEVRRKAAEAARIQQEAENAAAEAKRKELEAAAFAENLFGSAEQAETIAAAAQAVQPAKIGTVEIKTDGMRRVWKYRIVDVNLIPRDYMQPNETMIGQIVRAGKDTVRIPGVEVYFEETLAARAG